MKKNENTGGKQESSKQLRDRVRARPKPDVVEADKRGPGPGLQEDVFVYKQQAPGGQRGEERF